MEVIKKMTPKTSFIAGMTGFVELYSNSMLNILYYSLTTSYLALNSVNLFSTPLFVLNF